MLDTMKVQPLNLKDFQVEALMDEFITTKRAQRLSKNTLRIYIIEMTRFAKYSRDTAVGSLDQVTPTVLRDYMELTARNHNEGGAHIAYRVLRTWLRWVWLEYDLPGMPPIAKVKVRNPRPEPIQGVTPETVKIMLEACKYNRDRAIIALLFDSGVRAQEACNLLIGDLDMITGALTVRHGKGGKSRVTFVGSKTRAYLRKYLAERVTNEPTEPLFVTNRDDHLTVWALRMLIARLAKRAGIHPPRIHDFRRGCAIEMLRAGADPVTVMRLLGHSSLTTTLRYLRQTNADLQEQHRRNSPLDRL